MQSKNRPCFDNIWMQNQLKIMELKILVDQNCLWRFLTLLVVSTLLQNQKEIKRDCPLIFITSVF